MNLVSLNISPSIKDLVQEDQEDKDEEVHGLTAVGETPGATLTFPHRNRVQHHARHSQPRPFNGRQGALEPNLYIDTVGAGSNDPFRTLPEMAMGETGFLAYYWNSYFVHLTTAPAPRQKWFPFALTDPAFFHATLHIAASHIAGLNRTRVSPAFFHHRGEVIRIVSERITSTHAAASDGTIGAITMLLVTDSMSGHPERARAHMAGLQQLIFARGGISELNPLVARAASWADLLASISLMGRPLFHPPQFMEPDLPSYYGPPSTSTALYALGFKSRLLNFTGNDELSELAATILWGLRNISIKKQTANQMEMMTADCIPFSDRVELLERETEKLLHDCLDEIGSASTSGKLHTLGILTLFAHAVLIHICFEFREMVCSYLTVEIASRLEIGMDLPDPELNILLGTFPELMLWILFIGGGAAKYKSRVWFAKTASKILRVQKMNEEESIKNASKSFLWPEGRENYDDSIEHDVEKADIEPMDVDLDTVK